MTSAGKWDQQYSLLGKEPGAYGKTDSYKLGAEWLKDCERIEDWGCGAGYLTNYVASERYRGIDGSKTHFAAEIVDLETYRSSVPGIFMRHVLEHNFSWQKILENALGSFTERMALVLFTPLVHGPTRNIEWEDPPGVPNLAFSPDDIEAAINNHPDNIKLLGPGFLPSAEVKYGCETMYYLAKND